MNNYAIKDSGEREVFVPKKALLDYMGVGSEGR